MVVALHVASFSTAGGHWMRVDGALVVLSLLQHVYTAYFLVVCFIGGEMGEVGMSVCV